MRTKLTSLLFTALTTTLLIACGPSDTQSADQYVVLGKGDGTVPAVQLISAESWNHQKYGQSDKEKSFVIRVRNLAYRKTVAIHHRTVGGQWVDLAADYVGPADASGQTEIWKASTHSVDFDSQFVVKLAVDGVTYWDNNNGHDYHLGHEDGPMLGTGINVMAGGTASFLPHGRSYLYKFSGVVNVRNVGPVKTVKVHYSYDNWTTTQTIDAHYIGNTRTYGYSSVSNPNVHGIEGWQFDEVVYSLEKKIAYYISYEVDGVTYFDNDYGKNYSAEFTTWP